MRERTVLGPTGLDQFFLSQNVQFSAYILYTNFLHRISFEHLIILQVSTDKTTDYLLSIKRLFFCAYKRWFRIELNIIYYKNIGGIGYKLMKLRIPLSYTPKDKLQCMLYMYQCEMSYNKNIIIVQINIIHVCIVLYISVIRSIYRIHE